MKTDKTDNTFDKWTIINLFAISIVLLMLVLTDDNHIGHIKKLENKVEVLQHQMDSINTANTIIYPLD